MGTSDGGAIGPVSNDSSPLKCLFIDSLVRFQTLQPNGRRKHSPASFSSRTEKPTVPILHTVPSTPDALPTAPIRHLRLSPQDLRPGSQRLHPNPSGANLVSPPPKRTQPRCENKEVLRGTIVRHRARQRAAHGNQRRRMRADKQRLAGALVGALRLLQGRDLGVHVGDYACERGGEAIVQLGDGLAAGRGDEVRLVL